MKQRLLLTILAGALLFQPLRALGPMPLDEACARAAAEGKFLYVAFLGEGWSVASGKFAAKVLESDDFKTFAASRLVFFPVLARRDPPLSREETALLQSWVIHFDIKSYPTVILLGPDGREVLRHAYRDITSARYVELLSAIIGEEAGPAAP